MQRYRLEVEGIPKYINMLEDAQKQSGRSGRAIADKTLLLFASTAIVTTEWYPSTNNNWEDWAKEQKTWANWKTSYKVAHAKARVKAQATEESDKFGAANASKRVLKTSKVEMNNGGDKVGIKALEGYFDNLATSDINKKSVLEKLVANNVKLATTNEGLVAIVKQFSNKIKNLDWDTYRLKKTGGNRASQGKRDLTLCPQCKKGGYHSPDACFELAKNKYKRSPGCKSCLWGCRIVSKAELSKYGIDKLLTHTINFSPTLDIENLTLPNSSKVQANHTRQQHVLPKKSTGIFGSGATNICFAAYSPVVNIDRAAPKVTVGTATGQTQKYTGTGNLALPHLPSGFPIKGHLMPCLYHTLIGVGSLCDADCAVTSMRESAIIHDKQGTAMLTGWREATGPSLWRISLQPG